MKAEQKVILEDFVEIRVKFSEIDSMRRAWHGSYVTYMEDGRESFGLHYPGIGYADITASGIYAPIVDIHVKYYGPLELNDIVVIRTRYVYHPGARLDYNYEMRRKSDGALCCRATTTQLFIDPEGKLLRYLRYNCFIAILPFCMGVLAARHFNHSSLSIDKPAICLRWLVLSSILLIACKFNFYSWLVMPVFVIITGLTLVKLIIKVKWLDIIFGWLGALSGVLFVVHPIVRQVLLPKANESGAYAITLLIYLIITIGLSLLLKPVFIRKK